MAFQRKNAKTAKGKKNTSQDSESENIFPAGIVVFEPHERAPEFVNAEIIISVDAFGKFLEENEELLSEHEKYGKQLHLTLKTSKTGAMYLQVNDYYAKKQ